MTFLKYIIITPSFENLDILNILITLYRSNYILQCADNILYLYNLLQSYLRLPKQHMLLSKYVYTFS